MTNDRITNKGDQKEMTEDGIKTTTDTKEAQGGMTTDTIDGDRTRAVDTEHHQTTDTSAALGQTEADTTVVTDPTPETDTTETT